MYNNFGASLQGIGDFCMAPNPFFEELASGQVESGPLLSTVTLLCYSHS